MCGQCRLIGIDIVLARRTLQGLVKETQVTSSSSSLTEEMLSRLEDHIAYFCRDAGYTRARFKRVRTKTL